MFMNIFQRDGGIYFDLNDLTVAVTKLIDVLMM